MSDAQGPSAPHSDASVTALQYASVKAGSFQTSASADPSWKVTFISPTIRRAPDIATGGSVVHSGTSAK